MEVQHNVRFDSTSSDDSLSTVAVQYRVAAERCRRKRAAGGNCTVGRTKMQEGVLIRKRTSRLKVTKGKAFLQEEGLWEWKPHHKWIATQYGQGKAGVAPYAADGSKIESRRDKRSAREGLIQSLRSRETALHQTGTDANKCAILSRRDTRRCAKYSQEETPGDARKVVEIEKKVRKNQDEITRLEHKKEQAMREGLQQGNTHTFRAVEERRPEFPDGGTQLPPDAMRAEMHNLLEWFTRFMEGVEKA